VVLLRPPTVRVLLAVALCGGAFLVGLAPVADGDLWWHLAAGREIVRTHALLRVDPFSSGAFGRPWVDVHWLFQLAVFAVHAWGGLTALVLGKCALVAAGALVLGAAVARAAGPRARLPFALALPAALLAARSLLLLRPVIPTLAWLAVFFWCLERHRGGGGVRSLAPLPALQVVWANFQGLSMLGPALVAAYAVGAGAWAALGARASYPFAERFASAEEARRAALALGLTLVLCLAACVATPFGLGGLALPFRLLARFEPAAGNVYANVAENVPPFVAERMAPGQFGHLPWYLALTAVALLASRRLPLAHLLVLGGFVALALAANRNVLLLYWLGTPITIVAVTPALRRAAVAWRRRRRAGLALARAVPAAALVGVLALASTAAAREPSLAVPAPWRAPVESARFISARAAGGAPDAPPGTIFAADQFGGYLIWALTPRFRPFMDTRLVLRSADEYAEYLALVDAPPRFDAWEARHPVDYVLLPVGYPDRYLGLVAHLYASERWSLVYTDGAEVLFAHRAATDAAPGDLASIDLASPSTVDGLRAGLERRFAGAPRLAEAGRLQLAMLELAAGEPDEAERALAGSRSPDAEALRARCRLVAGDLDAAARDAEELLSRDGDDVRGLDVLAVVSARRGDSAKAIAFLRRALSVNPFDSEAKRILATWEEPAARAHD
jgi:hypothetical protein